MLTNVVNVGTSLATTLARGASGISVGDLGTRPTEPLELYEFEGCPFCRKVREALSILDLDAIVYPCPKNGPRFRPEVERRGGRAMFPYLADPNTGREMYESGDIVRYLFDRYGDGRVPTLLALGPVTDLSSVLAGLARAGMGGFYKEAKQPEELLELYSFEASPFCRIVRERLTTLELPYVLHNVAKGSPKREEFIERSGKMQVPYLVDPNTGTEMFESADIVAYLDREYAG
jgi:glutathione S-transferase